jgi:AcrR family transcriptional regulator
MTAAAKTSARQRLLDAADELFYNEGVQTVGIDRVIERAGVAKASLYNAFGSKDELVGAYLRTRGESTQQRILDAIGRHDDPRAKLLAIFDSQAAAFAKPTYHGCAFMAASAEARPGSSIEQATAEYRGWLRQLFADLAGAAGASKPDVLGRQLYLIYDGATVAARIDRDESVGTTARDAAAALLEATLPAQRRTQAPSTPSVRRGVS